MRQILGLVAVLVLGTGAVGCASPVRGQPLPDPGAPVTTTTSTPAVDPNSRAARWMNDLCGAAKLLVTAGETGPQPRTTSDPAVLKREFSETTGRLVNIFDAVLSDLRRLIPAPAPGLDDVIGTLVEHMSAAREATNHAKSTVDAADPLTVEAFDAAIAEFSRGLASMQKAVDFLKVVTLPEQMVQAGAVAPNCAESGFPVGQR